MTCEVLTRLEGKLQVEYDSIKYWSSRGSKGLASDAELGRQVAAARERLPKRVDAIETHKADCAICAAIASQGRS
jgi:hypothetical protein